MKTSKSKASAPRQKADVQLVACLVLFFSVFSLALSGQDLISRKSHLDFGFDYYSSGNGHGAFYAPTLFLNKKYKALAFAPIIQKKSMKAGGFKLSFIQNLTGRAIDSFEDDSLSSEDSVMIGKFRAYSASHKKFFQLNYFVYLQYNKPLPLSSDVIRLEQNAKRDNVNWNSVYLNTGEAGAGIELQLNVSNTWSIKAYAGMSVYHHFTYLHKLDNGRNAMTLTIGSCVSMSLNELFKHKRTRYTSNDALSHNETIYNKL